MIYKLNNFLKIFLLLSYTVSVINGECVLNYPTNHLIKPKLAKKLGSRKMKLPVDNKQFNTLHNNEEIIASCDIKFEKPKNYDYRRENNIRCHGKHLYINGNRYASKVYFECAAINWNLYELLQPYIWCPIHLSSFALARPNGGELYTFGTVAGICYDTYNMSIASVNYKIEPRNLKDVSGSSSLIYGRQPMMEVKYRKDTFMLRSNTSAKYLNKKFKDWIKSANYKYASIIQNSLMNTETYKEFISLFVFQWWPNLRLNNWHYYEEALTKRVEMEGKPYNILAGVSGVLMAPIAESCDNNYTLRHVIDNSNNIIPLYVWNYVYPIEVSDDDPGIVIIGFNSPFNEFYEEADIKFCSDICETIDWLESVRATFSKSIMGIMFCCSVEEVRSSGKLSDFPEYMTQPPPEEKTTKAPKADKADKAAKTSKPTKAGKGAKAGKPTKAGKGGKDGTTTKASKGGAKKKKKPK